MPSKKCNCENCWNTKFQADVRRLFQAGDDGKQADWKTVDGLQAALRRLDGHRPADAPAIRAEVAGIIALLTVRIPTWKPRQGALLAIFDGAANPKEKAKS
jgi:hypothetical protein